MTLSPSKNVILVLLAVMGAGSLRPQASQEMPWTASAAGAERLSERGHHGEAIRLAREALASAEKLEGERSDETLRLRGRLAYFHWMAGDGAEAESIVRGLESMRPASVESLLQAARIRLLQKDYGSAEKLLARARSLGPDDPRVLIERGRVFASTNRCEKAAESFERYLQTDPSPYWLYGELARCYAQMGRRDLMADAFRRAKQYADGDAQHFVTLGYGYLRLGDSAGALDSFEKAAAARPDHPWAFRHLGTHYQALGKGDEAVAAYDRVLALCEKDPSLASEDLLHVVDQLAEIHLGAGRRLDAEAVARRTASLRGRIDRRLWLAILPHAAGIYARLGRGPDVDKLYAAEKGTPDDSPVERLFLQAEHARSLRILGDAVRARGALDDFASAWRSLPSPGPEEKNRLALALNIAGETALSLGEDARAGDFFAGSLALWPKWDRRFEVVTAIRGLAESQSRRGQVREVRRLYEKAVDDIAQEPPMRFDDLELTSQQEDDLAEFAGRLLDVYKAEGLRREARALVRRIEKWKRQGRWRDSEEVR